MKRLLPGLYALLALCALLTMGSAWACERIKLAQDTQHLVKTMKFPYPTKK